MTCSATACSRSSGSGSPEHGFDTPDVIADAGMTEEWNRVMEDSAATWATLSEHAGEDVAQYSVAMAYRIRFVMQMSAREAMHLIELRSSPQGHPTYRGSRSRCTT